MKKTWLENKRKALNLSQSDMSILLNVSRQHYNFIENGNRKPSPELAKRIAIVLGFKNEWYKLLEEDE